MAINMGEMGSYAQGGARAPVFTSGRDCHTVIDALESAAERFPGQLAYQFLERGEVEGARLTYGELLARTRAIAGALRAQVAPGERALLVYPPGLEYLPAFLGCLYAGVIAVPVYPPDPARLTQTVPRVREIAKDSGAAVALTTGVFRDFGEALAAQDPEFPAMVWMATDTVDAGLGGGKAPVIEVDSIAFLQYTSGSTASPRGVMVTHANLMYNLEDMSRSAFAHESKRLVSWLPTFHDMGLILGLLHPLYMTYPCYLMSPLDFLQRPLRWLYAISKYRGTHTSAPNFAYDLCVRKVKPEQIAELDLSCMRVFANGAEPVRPATLERFVETFAPCGVRADMMTPGYGLAEATLKVSSCHRDAPPVYLTVSGPDLERFRVTPVAADSPGARTVVSCGETRLETRVVIAHPESRRRCAFDEVGEIWVSGPAVAKGYWNRVEETCEVFEARLADTGEGPFLRTGDLGFVYKGELFVTGRIKDLIIIDGQNRYPQDIEWVAEQSHPALRPGCCAAFSIERDGAERLVITAEVARNYGNGGGHNGGVDPQEIVAAVRSAVARHYDVRAHDIVLLNAGAIPKTSSGKLQRRATRAAYLDGSLELWEN